jgi:diguanylate cyclase (GGDEF)-like protein
VAAALRRGLRNRQKLLGIVSLADRLREANRKLTQQKRRLLEEKRQLALKSRQLNLINELSSAASATLEPGRIVGGVGGRLCRELPISSWAVLFAPPGGERATLFVPGPLGQGAAQELGRGLIERLARVGGKGRGFEVSSVGRRALAPEAAAALAREAGLVLPLLAGGQLIGLYKLLPEVPLSAELVRLGESAANMVALGLKNAGELMLARRLAERDGLTRIANRRAFERQLRREFSRSRRYRQPLTLIMADIDHFKRINDRYGHQVGDRVLCQVARLFSETVRHSDFVARYGGEEFVVILPETGLESSLVLAGRLKRSVEERPLLAVPEPLSLTLSLGLADTGAPLTDEAPDLVRLADRALYVAKARGRNRISTWLDIAEMEARPASAGQTPPRGWQLWEAN